VNRLLPAQRSSVPVPARLVLQESAEVAHPGVGDRLREGTQLRHPGDVKSSIVNRDSLVAHQ